MKNIWQTAVSGVLLLLLTACAVSPVETPVQIALLAPFEGRYRDVGYNALYAVQLALSEHDEQVELLAVDDGGSSESASDRARALVLNERVVGVIVLGYAATDAATLESFGTLPVVVAGYWGVQDTNANIITLHHPEVPDQVLVPPREPITRLSRAVPLLAGGLVLSLPLFTKLVADLDGVRLAASFPLPDAEFTERYLTSSPFAPEPGLIAMAAYISARFIVEQVQADSTRETVLTALQTAPMPDMALYVYRFDTNGTLIPIDGLVEER